MKSKGILINKVNNNTNESIAFIVNKNIKEDKLKNKYGIIYMNSSLYINNYFGEGKNIQSEIILKYKIKEEKYNINYMLINLNKSSNIFINDIIIKNIY